jgi:hypothetical protein
VCQLILENVLAFPSFLIVATINVAQTCDERRSTDWLHLIEVARQQRMKASEWLIENA